MVLTLLAASASSLRSILRAKRRYFIVGSFVLAAVLTPPDVISQLSLAIPLMLLYEGAIWSARLVEKKRESCGASRRSDARLHGGGIINPPRPKRPDTRRTGFSAVLMRPERPVERREAQPALIALTSGGARLAVSGLAPPEAVPPGNRNGP